MSKAPAPNMEMLGAMLDSLSIAAYTFDKDRKVIYSNKAAKVTQETAIEGRSIGAAEQHHFEQNEYYDEHGEKLSKERVSVIDRALRGEETREVLLEHRNLKKRTHTWIEVSCIPVMEDGIFSYGILTYKDVSSKKRRDDKLKFLLASTKILSITMDFRDRLQKKAELAVPSLADWCSIEIVNGEGKIERHALVHRDPKKVAMIKRYEKKYPNQGESSAERVIRTGKAEFTPVITQEMIDAVPNLTAEQRSDITALELSSIITLPIGTPRRVLGALTVAFAESGRTYTEEDVSFFREFSYHLSVLLDNARLYNEIRVRDEAKDVFLASLSHELRNPLAPIRTSLELLQLQNKDANISADIDVIEHQFDHMAHLLNDLLDSNRFIRGKIRIDLVPLELMDIVRQVVRALQTVADEQGVTLSLESEEPRYIVRADKVRMEQALNNILTNAIKFTPSGGQIKIRVCSKDGHVNVEVRDTGAGITEEEMAHIFEPYYQSERVRGDNTGLGIGLRLVNEIVQLHEGTISAKSDGSGSGSVFTITLPERTESELENAAAPLLEESAAKKVVIVDDNRAAADGLVRLLGALGWEASALYSGKDLIAYLPEHDVDVAIIDIGMPDMDGYAVVKELRAQGRTLPAVALTGYGFDEDKQRALSAGFTAHLTKPVGAQELQATIAELVT